MAAEFLAVGHIVKDIESGGGWRPGGSVAYATMQAHRLGLSTVGVTRCSPDISPAELFPQTRWHVLPDERTTAFENTYRDGIRSQRIIDCARPIGAAEIPASWRDTPIVLLAPVFHDVDVRAGSVFPRESLVGLSCQGWLRQLRGSQVVPGEVDPDAPWLLGDVVFLSEEDATDADAASCWLTYVPTVVVTRGREGFTVFDDAGRHDFPAATAREVDPTGAGDVFSTAFLVRWHETRGRLEECARFAAAAASLAVQGVGLDAVPTRAEIEAVLHAHAAREAP